MPVKCIIYTRVSDPSQVDNMSLDDQEMHCYKYAKSKGWTVATKPFREEGRSAKNISRPQLKEATKFSLDKKNKIDYILVYKLWRFSRNLDESSPLELLLSKNGVKILSVTEPFKDDPYGRFNHKLMILMGQLDNEVKGEIVADNMKARFRDGNWQWKTPFGYTRKYPPKQKPEEVKNNPVLIDKIEGPIVSHIFNLAASGVFDRPKLRDELISLGYEKYVGTMPDTKTVETILRKTFYYGLMHAKRWDLYVYGNYTPLVSEGIWRRANHYIFGTPSTHNAKDQALYPLKTFIRCSKCSSTAKAYENKKKGIHYYECKNKKCTGAGKFRKEVESLHDDFLNLLCFYKPSREILALFDHLVFSEWDKALRLLEKERLEVKEKMEDQKKWIDTVLDRFDRGDYTDDEKRKKIADARLEISLLGENMQESNYEGYQIEEVKAFIEFFLGNLDRFWLRLDHKQRLIFQNMLFPKGVPHNREKFLTNNIDELCSSISLIKEIADSNGDLVTPSRIELELPE